MGGNAWKTQTSRLILGNEEAAELAFRLREATLEVTFLTQVIYQQATPLLIEVLETLIGSVDALRQQTLTTEEQQVREYLQNTIQGMVNRGAFVDRRNLPRLTVGDPRKVKRSPRGSLEDIARLEAKSQAANTVAAQRVSEGINRVRGKRPEKQKDE